jgi:hypothetical protein
MAHLVRFSLPERELGKADIEFRVLKNSRVVGILKVSKGSIVWKRSHRQYGKKLGWHSFDQIMEENGTWE